VYLNQHRTQNSQGIFDGASVRTGVTGGSLNLPFDDLHSIAIDTTQLIPPKLKSHLHLLVKQYGHSVVSSALSELSPSHL